jgi:type IX secretion system substrate protein
MKKIYKLLTILALPSILILYSYSTGSPGGKTGSMGDGGNTCTDCHSGTAQSQSDWITTNIPMEGFIAGETYLITATGTHSGVVKFGFELTAEDAFTAKVGTFAITEPTRTQQANANKSVTHTSGGNTPTGNMNSWSMEWTAPASSPSLVIFNAAFNAANGNGGTSGDQIYTTEISVSQYVLSPEITEVDPDHAPQGFNGMITITGNDNEWTSGVTDVLFKYHDDNSIFFEASQINVSNDNMLSVDIDIPVSTDIGNYDVYVDDLMLENGFVVDIIDAIGDDLLTNSISVYPNPALNYAEVSAPVGASYMVLDISGKMMKQSVMIDDKSVIDVSGYNTGLYFIQIAHLGNIHTKKLIVK